MSILEALKSPRAFIVGALIAATLQTGILVKILYDRASLLSSGTEVVLQSRMVDPRDLFRGHYVWLQLTAGVIKNGDIEIAGDIKPSDTVFVELVKSDNGFWIASRMHKKFPENLGAAVLKGKVSFGDTASDPIYRVRFPFDRYFAPKKRAKELEKIRNQGTLGVILALDGKGGGMVKGIQVDGVPIYNEPIL